MTQKQVQTPIVWVQALSFQNLWGRRDNTVKIRFGDVIAWVIMLAPNVHKQVAYLLLKGSSKMPDHFSSIS